MTSMPPLALLAGGLAKRLRPVTDTIPKSMVEVAGKPFIHHQLNLLKREGITAAVICIGHLGEQIQDYARDGARFGLKVDYSIEGKELLGTGGAIKKALPGLGELFWVMYGDSYLDISFAPILKYFSSHDQDGLMTVYLNENQWDKSNVLFQDGRIDKYDKQSPADDMKFIDYGLGLFRKSAFAPWQDIDVFDLAQVYQGLIDRQQLLGYEVKQRFYEIGSSAGLQETRRYFQEIEK